MRSDRGFKSEGEEKDFSERDGREFWSEGEEGVTSSEGHNSKSRKKIAQKNQNMKESQIKKERGKCIIK